MYSSRMLPLFRSAGLRAGSFPPRSRFQRVARIVSTAQRHILSVELSRPATVAIGAVCGQAAAGLTSLSWRATLYDGEIEVWTLTEVQMPSHSQQPDSIKAAEITN